MGIVMKENIKSRRIIANVKGEEFEFDELYCVDQISGEEIFDREIEIENGAIQSEAIDSILRLCEDPDNMYKLLYNNRSNLSEEIFTNCEENVCRLKKYKEHKIAIIKENEFTNLLFDTIDLNDVTLKIIEIYNKKIDNIRLNYNIEEYYSEEYITQLKLQKLLYYVQGISLRIFAKPAFNSSIYNWTYGPVIKDIYHEYKKNGKNQIVNLENTVKVSDGLLKIIEIVIDSYGQMGTFKLIDFTHEEDPWLNTKKDDEISLEEIKKYFNLVYS